MALKEDATYVLFDADRTDWMTMPPFAFQLWMIYYTHERNTGESWMSLSLIEAKWGKDVKTILKWQRWLKANGWLVETGETAADKYGDKATRGSHQVKVVRVDDPKRGATTGNIPVAKAGDLLANPTTGKLPEVVTTGESPVKVSCSSSVSSSVSSSPSASGSDSASSSSTCTGQSHPPAEEKKEKENPEPKTKKPKTAEDGTPYPEGFDAWKNAHRIEWLDRHKSVGEPRKDKPEAKPVPAWPAAYREKNPPKPEQCLDCGELAFPGESHVCPP